MEQTPAPYPKRLAEVYPSTARVLALPSCISGCASLPLPVCFQLLVLSTSTTPLLSNKPCSVDSPTISLTLTSPSALIEEAIVVQNFSQFPNRNCTLCFKKELSINSIPVGNSFPVCGHFFFRLCQIFNKHLDSDLFLNNMPVGSHACSFNLHQSVLQPGLHFNVSAATSGFDVPRRSSLASVLIY